ncbi:HTH-type transcriptional activator CmpR [Ralstonia edaphis]|uniref:LysR family transcriptional regulator n=1 Tax=Ralstonia edaphi TaxID=3058599 RepID=UPI0028F6778F|nr:LysR family transcriptional regulator [Ralstonia sp. LMG 6871]CAJ0712335.1 HTH-type transcriptional activator CmpR [Ralstonia sp. LMG 6871]
MLEEMRTFVLLAQTGSIARVAERLPLTQPAVTKQIQRLERALDTVLFDRRVKPFRLTAEGEAVLARCRTIVGEFEALRGSVRATGEPEGVLRVGVSHAVGNARFARVLAGLRERYPAVSFRLSCEWGGVLRERLNRAELDAALWLAPSGPRGYHADAGIRVIGTEPVRLIAAPSRKLPATLSMAQVTDEAWVLNPAGCEMRAWLLGRYEADRLTPNVAAEVQSVPLQHALVAEGFGLGFAPVRLIEPQIAEGTLSMHRLASAPSVWDVCVQRAPSLGRLARVVDALEAALSTEAAAAR